MSVSVCGGGGGGGRERVSIIRINKDLNKLFQQNHSMPASIAV